MHVKVPNGDVRYVAHGETKWFRNRRPTGLREIVRDCRDCGVDPLEFVNSITVRLDVFMDEVAFDCQV